MPRPTIGSLKERFARALRTLRPFIAMVWRTSPSLTASSLLLRLVRALLPVVSPLYRQADHRRRRAAGADAGQAGDAASNGWTSGLLNWLGVLLRWPSSRLAVLSDMLGRVVALVDSLVVGARDQRLERQPDGARRDARPARISRTPSSRTSSSGRAGRPAAGLTLMSQLFGQAQDIVTVASFAAGLVVYAPWLIVLLLVALVPAFLGEAHFNAQSYSLDYAPHARAARARLCAPDRGQRRDRQGSEDLRPQRAS